MADSSDYDEDDLTENFRHPLKSHATSKQVNGDVTPRLANSPRRSRRQSDGSLSESELKKLEDARHRATSVSVMVPDASKICLTFLTPQCYI